MLLAAPLLLILVLFALSNRQAVELGFWPTDYTVNPPISLAILIAMGLAFLVGGLMVWGGTLAQRRRARRAEGRVRLLEAEIESLRARLLVPAASPAGTSALAVLPAIDA